MNERSKKKQAIQSDKPIFDIEKYLFKEQLAFIQDPNPFSTALCSRRAGKSVSCAADLVDTCLRNPDTVSAYITLSRKNAKRIIWPIIKQINREFQLGAKFNNTDLIVTFPNDSMIQLSGAKDSEESEKLRGLALIKIYIDECQSFRSHIRDLIDDVLAPALMDYGGKLRLIGTPGPIPTGFFFEACRSDSYAHHEWTFFQNPHIALKSGKTHQELLERELKRRGVLSTNPGIQREWFGKWILDSDSLVLHYAPDRNDFEKVPEGQNQFILGVDLGHEDADALAILAYNEQSHNVWLVDEMLTKRQDITALVSQIQQLRQIYSIYKIVIDTGGLGKKIAEELQRRHGVPLQAADKTRKFENLTLLDDALRTGRFKAHRVSQFAQDCNLVEVDREKSTSERLVISDRYHSDIVDAVLYAFREAMAWAINKEPERPKPGTAAWYKWQTDEMERQEIERLEKAEGDANKITGGGWW